MTLAPQPLPPWVADFRPATAPGESYYGYLTRAVGELDVLLDGSLLLGKNLSRYFREAELVADDRRKLQPAPDLWPNMPVTLALVLLFRQTQITLGFGPLEVQATYRPGSGAGKSRHKVNAAIDVIPWPRRTPDPCRAMMVGAGWIWRHHEHLRVGVGTYGPHLDRTVTVHIDALQRPRRTCWRQIAGVSTTPAIPQLGPAPWET